MGTMVQKSFIASTFPTEMNSPSVYYIILFKEYLQRKAGPLNVKDPKYIIISMYFYFHSGED